MARHTIPSAALPGGGSVDVAAPIGATAASERPREQDDDRTRHQSATRVGLLGLVHFVNDAYSCVLTALLPAVLPALGLTIGAGGVLTATYQVVSAVLQPVVGHLSDRRGMGWPIWAGLGLTALGSSFVGLAPTFPVLLACAAVASVGTSLFHPVAAVTVGRLSPDDARGRWMGLYETVGWAGTVVGPLVIGLTVEMGRPAHLADRPAGAGARPGADAARPEPVTRRGAVDARDHGRPRGPARPPARLPRRLHAGGQPAGLDVQRGGPVFAAARERGRAGRGRRRAPADRLPGGRRPRQPGLRLGVRPPRGALGRGRCAGAGRAARTGDDRGRAARPRPVRVRGGESGSC